MNALFFNPRLKSFVCDLLCESLWIGRGLFGLSARLEVEEGGHYGLIKSVYVSV